MITINLFVKRKPTDTPKQTKYFFLTTEINKCVHK